MSFRILTPLTTNRMSRLIFITLLCSVVLILTPQTAQATRRSRLDLSLAPTANVNASSTNNAEATAVLSNELAKPLESLNNAEALPLKAEQSSASSLSETVPLQQEKIQLKESVTPIAVDTGKSAGGDLSAEDEKLYSQDSESVKEQKEEVPTASFEDVEIVDSATQLAATGSSSDTSQHSHEECDPEMLGFEIVTG